MATLCGPRLVLLLLAHLSIFSVLPLHHILGLLEQRVDLAISKVFYVDISQRERN